MPSKSNKGKSKQSSKSNRVKSNSRPNVSNTPKKGKRRGNSNGMILSPCAWKYARALLDPFGSPPGACIPTVPGVPSKKGQSFIRGSFTTGTAGAGFIALNPFNMVSATPISVIYSNNAATFTGNSITTSSIPTGCLAASSNSPFTSTSFGAGGQAKLVACGVRIKCTSAPLYRQGMIYAMQQPAHGSLNSYGTVQFGSDSHAYNMPTDGEWVNLIYTPIASADYTEYIPGTSTTNLDALTTSGQGFMGILAYGATAANPMTFMYEVFAHYELLSSYIPDVTPTDSDIVGLSAVQNLVGRQHWYAWRGASLDTGKIWNTISEFGSSAISHFGPSLMNAGAKALGSYLGGPMGGAAVGLLTNGSDKGPIVEEIM